MALSGSDVIVAPASGAGRAAVAVVRLSGKGSSAVVEALAGTGFERDRRMRLAWLRHPGTGRVLDQAMVVFYQDGASFTGEESVEIFCHGGPVIVDSIVRACVDVGAVPAKPGEFTRRAVANGRMDLVQAEAVALLTESLSEVSADVAIRALGGSSSEILSALSSELLDVLADFEASLDFDEADDIYVDLSVHNAGLKSAIEKIDGWIRDARSVRPAVSGFRVVLSGAPNAGKSTLFNALVGGDRAIVHDMPGTTRDVISEPVVLGGVTCVLFDTAGVRETDAGVEAEGVRRALRAAADADLILNVVECGDGEAVRTLADGVGADRIVSNVMVLSKSDLCAGVPAGLRVDIPVFAVSAKDGRGVAELLEHIAKTASDAVRSASGVAATVAGERQTTALCDARGHLAVAVASLDRQAPPEVTAASVRDAVLSLGEITGARITEEVLDRIFSRFCVGK